MFRAVGLSLRPEREVTEYDRKKLIKVFHACDRENKGCLNREDLKVAVVMLFGYKPSKLEVNSMTSSLPDTAGVTLDDFLKMMTIKKAAQLSIGDHRQIFSMFDAHCRGYLTADDFKRAFKHVCPHMCEQTAVEAFREVDRDADGMVCYRDFEFAVTYGEDEE
ncbi:EF-hand calcium-binding domain-containing protein 11 [Spea bombifrons]|uniref:EF-hand calcium-binding domain-containing protein 11 n=1 Tax=Spea bombifrons TaxID=233779 RepID=UPI00234BDEEA|nr:EF-hand calcium-binding domain-containing protein 11 [Spea bombifrons]